MHPPPSCTTAHTQARVHEHTRQTRDTRQEARALAHECWCCIHAVALMEEEERRRKKLWRHRHREVIVANCQSLPRWFPSTSNSATNNMCVQYCYHYLLCKSSLFLLMIERWQQQQQRCGLFGYQRVQIAVGLLHLISPLPDYTPVALSKKVSNSKVVTKFSFIILPNQNRTPRLLSWLQRHTLLLATWQLIRISNNINIQYICIPYLANGICEVLFSLI